MNTVFTTMYSKETPLRKNCSKGKGSKGTKPKFVTKTGTIYRYINCKVSEKIRALATEINCTKTKDELDTRSPSKFFLEVASMYNEANQKELNSLKIDGEDMHWFEGKGVVNNFEENFDINMTAEVAKDIDDYICFYYKKARKNYKLSGTNDDMMNFCEKPFVYFYHF